jgi:transcriptional regulator with XRE-family HTH domain
MASTERQRPPRRQGAEDRTGAGSGPGRAELVSFTNRSVVVRVGAKKRRYCATPGRGAAPALRPEQHMVMGDYHRARQGFSTDAELARVMGVHRSRVAAWKNGEMPDPANMELLTALGVVVHELAQFMDPEVIPDWLTTGQVEADGREPIELLREGALTEVLQLANATEHGAYV